MRPLLALLTLSLAAPARADEPSPLPLEPAEAAYLFLQRSTPVDAGVAEPPAAPPSAPAPGRLTGVIETRGTRTPLALATVLSAAGAVLAESDGEGRFTIHLPVGTHTLTLRASGHEPLTVTETLGREALEVRYRLLRVDLAFETVVRARRDEGPARVELSRVELKELPGTQGDPFKVTMLLPGVSAMASGLSYPVVRGAQPAATGFFLDGVRLPQLYHLLAGPAVVHPDFVERVDFFPGVLPARYGRLLGGVIDGRVAKPPERLKVTVSADLLNAGAFVALPLLDGKLNVSLAGRVSYTGPIIAAVAKAVFPSTPEAPQPTPVVGFGDYQGRVEWKSPAGTLRLLALGVVDEAGVKQSGPRTVTALFSSQFHRVDLAWRMPLLRGQLEAGALVGAEQLGLLGERDGAIFGQFLMQRQAASGRLRWQGDVGRAVSFEAGLEVERQWTAFDIDRSPGAFEGPAASFREPRTVGTLATAYGEATYAHGPWSAQLGLRVDGYLLDDGPSLAALEPRLLVRRALLPELGVRGSVGLAHQPPTVLLNLPVTDLAGLREGLQQAVKAEVGADARLPFGFEASASLFWNQLLRVVEYSLEDLLRDRARLDGGSGAGRAYGVEVLLRRRPEGRWFGWVSYTLQRSERFRASALFDDAGEVAGSVASWLPFEFDQTHVLNVTAGVVLPWQLHVSLGVHVNSGRPESGIVSSRAMREGFDPGALQPTWVPVSLSREPRLPPFLRVDARVSRTFTFDAFTLEAFLDVFNASGSQEVLGYTYLADPVPGGGRVLVKQPFAIPVVLPYLGVKAAY